MYSSGTTGRPKGVMLTHANMVAHTVNAHDGWEFEPGDKNMVSMPLFHVGGSSYVLFGIHDGVPSVMTRDPDGASLAGAILNGANRTFLVPAVLAQVLQAGPTRSSCSARSRPTPTAPRRCRRRCCGPRWRRGPTPTSSRSTASPRSPAWPPT